MYRREQDADNYWLRVECELLEIPPSDITVELAYAVIEYFPQFEVENDEIQRIFKFSTSAASG